MTTCLAENKTVKIGEYQITGKIGQGGVAEIYKARQESLDRDVAIKILSKKLSDDEDIVRRFERESMVIAKLNHPNIVHVIDKGYTSGRYYFVMSYIDGTSLRQVIDSAKVPFNTKLEMLVQVCKALDYAHKNGVIHRDIKPANVLIDRQGNALVADFGIAQILGTPDNEVTSTDVIMGTLAYMSPEQKISSTNVDHTTDIYAVGVMLYEILCGKKPLGHFRLPSEINPNLSKEFDRIVQKCMAQESKDRYQKVVELKDDLLNMMKSPETIQTPSMSDNSEFTIQGTSSKSFMGKCRYLDTIKETRYSSTILVENKINKSLYVIKKHSRGEVGRKEARLLSKLKHNNILNIHGAGGDLKNTVIILEYSQGGSLSDRMARKYSWEDAAKLVMQILEGLHHAHKNNIVHGNIRPSNVLFDLEETPKLADFGMPPHYDPIKKKNWYNPPEHKVSRQGDIYAVGVIFHQLVTGRNPSYDKPGNLRMDDVERSIPKPVLDIIKKMLAIRIARRYLSCDEILLDYDQFEQSYHEPVEKPKRKQPVVEKEEKKFPKWAYGVAAAVLLGSVIITLLIINFSK